MMVMAMSLVVRLLQIIERQVLKVLQIVQIEVLLERGGRPATHITLAPEPILIVQLFYFVILWTTTTTEHHRVLVVFGLGGRDQHQLRVELGRGACRGRCGGASSVAAARSAEEQSARVRVQIAAVVVYVAVMLECSLRFQWWHGWRGRWWRWQT